MALDLSPGSLIRSGSYLLFAFIGVLLLVRRRHHPWNLRLGAIFVMQGVSGTLFNVVGGNSATPDIPPDATWGPPALIVTGALSLAQAWLWISLGLPLLNDLSRRVRRVVLGAGAIVAAPWVVIVAGAIILNDWGPDKVALAQQIDGLAYSIHIPLLATLLIVAAELSRRAASQGPALWLVLLPAATEPALYAGDIFAYGEYVGSPIVGFVDYVRLLGFALYAASIVGGLRATGGPHGRLARNLTLGLLACVALTMFVTPSPGIQRSGIGGILLITAGLLALWGMLKFGLLGRDPGKPILSPATLAAIGLAALFMTAQVAQNFLSDELGLLAGGLVAGAAVFAAYPIQRAAERTLERHAKRGPAGEYRALAEHAWSDGNFGPKERLMLSETRRRLRLSAEAAQAIEDEVARRQRRGD